MKKVQTHTCQGKPSQAKQSVEFALYFVLLLLLLVVVVLLILLFVVIFSSCSLAFFFIFTSKIPKRYLRNAFFLFCSLFLLFSSSSNSVISVLLGGYILSFAVDNSLSVELTKAKW